MAGFFKKLFTKFSRGSRIDWDELEADLVTADIGIRRAMNIADQLRESKGLDAENLVEATREVLRQAFPATAPSLPAPPEGKPLVILVVGVNGTGKTTSAAKLGHLRKNAGPALPPARGAPLPGRRRGTAPELGGQAGNSHLQGSAQPGPGLRLL